MSEVAAATGAANERIAASRVTFIAEECQRRSRQNAFDNPKALMENIAVARRTPAMPRRVSFRNWAPIGSSVENFLVILRIASSSREPRVLRCFFRGPWFLRRFGCHR